MANAGMHSRRRCRFLSFKHMIHLLIEHSNNNGDTRHDRSAWPSAAAWCLWLQSYVSVYQAYSHGTMMAGPASRCIGEAMLILGNWPSVCGCLSWRCVFIGRARHRLGNTCDKGASMDKHCLNKRPMTFFQHFLVRAPGNAGGIMERDKSHSILVSFTSNSQFRAGPSCALPPHYVRAQTLLASSLPFNVLNSFHIPWSISTVCMKVSPILGVSISVTTTNTVATLSITLMSSSDILTFWLRQVEIDHTSIDIVVHARKRLALSQVTRRPCLGCIFSAG